MNNYDKFIINTILSHIAMDMENRTKIDGEDFTLVLAFTRKAIAEHLQYIKNNKHNDIINLINKYKKSFNIKNNFINTDGYYTEYGVELHKAIKHEIGEFIKDLQKLIE